MSQSIGIKSSPTGPFVYVENTVGESLAFGSDNTAQMFVLNTSASPNVVPATASANINFDPTANGNITFRPNGSGKINALNVASNVVSNKNYVTINTSTGELGSDNAPLSSISITGDTGGALTGSSFTFTGGTTGLSFGGLGSTQTLTFAGITANGGTVSLATDATTSTINIGTGAGVKTSTFGSVNTTSATTIQSGSGALNVISTGGALTVNSGTGALGISTDASATILSIGTGGAVKTTTIGSTNSTSATTVQSGSGALNVTSTGGALTVNSGTGALSISSDASATTVNIATGAAAKTVTLGSTTTTSSLALKYGTNDFTLASATGTVMSALDTGEITYPLQPAFFAYAAAQVNNVTGNGTVYVLGTTALTEVFDQGGDMNTNGTFTAPVTGRYNFSGQMLMIGCTVATTANIRLNSSNRTYFTQYARAAGPQNITASECTITDMDAGDTMTVSIQVSGEAGDTVDLSGGSGGGPDCWLSGFLVC